MKKKILHTSKPASEILRQIKLAIFATFPSQKLKRCPRRETAFRLIYDDSTALSTDYIEFQVWIDVVLHVKVRTVSGNSTEAWRQYLCGGKSRCERMFDFVYENLMNNLGLTESPCVGQIDPKNKKI